MITLCILIALAIVLISIYVFLGWNYDHWRKRGVNGPTPKILIGSFPNLFTQKQNFSVDLMDIYNNYKNTNNYVGIYMMRAPKLLILEPKLIHEVFVTAFKHFHDNEFGQLVDKKKDPLFANNPFVLNGNEWREQRAIINPGLTGMRIKVAYSIMQKVAQDFCDYIQREMKMAGSNGLNAKDIAVQFTSENVCDSVLGIKANSFTDNRIPVYDNMKMFQDNTIMLIYMFLIGFLPNLYKYFKVTFMPKACQDFLYNLTKKAIDLREQSKPDRQDFMNHLMALKEKHNLSHMELASHSMTFLIDGLDTTAIAIAHCLLLLGRNPDKQELLRQEILEHVNDNDEIDFDTLSEMPYFEACLHESMRIFPPAAWHSKMCTEPYEFTDKDDSKLRVEVDDVIFIPSYAIYMDPQYFPEPKEYKPERFLPENGGMKKYKDLGCFFPFGDGPRMCLGSRFALTQAKSAIATILRRFTVKVNPKTKPEDRLDPKAFFTLQDGGVWLDFEERGN